jgi:hypothetical protein
MIITLITWLYISIICLIWGNIFLQMVASKFGHTATLNCALTCMAGLSLIGGCSLLISLFIPLGGWAQSSVLWPAVIYCLFSRNRRRLVTQVRLFASSFSWKGYSMLAICMLMVLVINAHVVIHPDTLMYHNQSIEWFEKYKAVPGIAHLRLELGFQSLWFASQAIFSFEAFRPNPSFFLSGCLLCWYLLFIVGMIERSLNGRNKNAQPIPGSAWGWALLLIYSMVSWTQVRLTAASASPDFPAAIYILASLFAFRQTPYNPSEKGAYLLVSILFCFTAVSIKFSALAIILLAFWIIIHFIRQKRFSEMFFAVCLGGFMIIPCLVRNFIASGYPFYPISFFNVARPDWQLPLSTLTGFQHYITAYARFPISRVTANENFLLPISKWIPGWWHHLSIPDQLMIFGVLWACMLNLIFLRSALAQLRKTNLAIFFIFSSGVLLWFFEAPDPRFGIGFLAGLLFILCSNIKEKMYTQLEQAAAAGYRLLLAAFSLSILLYTGHRFISFFKPGDLVFPAGIEKMNYRSLVCEGITVNMPLEKDSVCGSIPVPCSTESCRTFKLRGHTIGDGFKRPD